MENKWGKIVNIVDELHELNRQWFEANRHLSNQLMLDAGLIDECDLVWVDKFRGEQNE